MIKENIDRLITDLYNAIDYHYHIKRGRGYLIRKLSGIFAYLDIHRAQLWRYRYKS